MMIRTGILTISDRSSRGERKDESGPALAKLITDQGWPITYSEIIPDDFERIKSLLETCCDQDLVDVLVTTGGTGFAPRDVTPEATRAVITRETPGLSELMRAESLKITRHAALSRAICGIRERTLIINLPGSPKAAVENLSYVLPLLPHAVELLRELPTSEAGHRNI